MPDFFSMRRPGAACLLLALALLPARLYAGPPQPGPGSSGFDICGALATAPGLTEAWPAANAGVRPGETVMDTDKGFGCRFTPAGKPGSGPVLLEARLTRPTASGVGTAVDRWRVPARKGEPAAIVYAFYPPGRARPGEWSLEVYDGETRLAATTFTVTGAAVRGSVEPPASEEALPDAPQEAAPSDPSAGSVPTSEATPQAPSRPATDTPAPPVATSAAPASEAAPRPAPDTASETPGPQSAPKAAPSEAARPKPAQPAVSKPAATAKGIPAKQVAAKPAATAATGFYALQTGLFADATNADAQAAKLRGRGIPACVVAESGAKGRRYRVLAGRYGDKRAALTMRGEVGRAAGVRPLLFAVDAAQAGRLRCH
ncbi:SPOR domain-containing protein [Desulfovibrio sp. JY]|nr:SPOR domain-containing protein [Desulfovibrio sp. JY]